MSHGEEDGDKGMKSKTEELGEGREKKDGGKSSRGSVAVDLALGWLRKLHVFLAGHEPSQLQQHHPDTVGVLPLGQCSHCMHVNLQDREQVRMGVWMDGLKITNNRYMYLI